MDINVFDDRKTKSATVRILSDEPYMERLIEAVLSPRFSREDGSAFLTVVCLSGNAAEVSGPCVFVGCRPQSLSDGQVVMDRPLDISEFYLTCSELYDRFSLQCGAWSYEPERRIASFNGRKVPLTAREGQLFSLLLSRVGECVSREEIDALLWRGETSGNCADVYVCYLRKKLERIADPGMLMSVRGRGYLLKKP